jgi:hypothetical protein
LGPRGTAISPEQKLPIFFLDNHLCDTLATEGLAAHKLLLFQSGQCIACSRKHQDHGRGDQAARVHDDAQPLDQGHDAVNGGAHIVGREAADEGIEFGGCRTDAQKERDFDEDEDQG